MSESDGGIVAQPASLSEPEPVQPKKKRRRREPMPDVLKDRAASAARQHAKRYPAPEVEIVKSGGSWSIESPYRPTDEEEWWRLLGEAFGTRTKRVILVFMDQIAALIGTEWDEATQTHRPDENQIQAALSIVAAMKPRNEAEAAQAAQLFAVHLATMRVAAGLHRYAGSYVDPRQANALANLVKAYSGGMDSMRKGRSKSATRQTIVVKKDVRIFNDNRSVTLGGRGSAAADQPDGAEGNTRGRAKVVEGRTRAIEGCPTLPSSPEVRGAMQIARDEGQEGVPGPRGKVAGSA